jgi:hypothetical protein
MDDLRPGQQDTSLLMGGSLLHDRVLEAERSWVPLFVVLAMFGLLGGCELMEPQPRHLSHEQRSAAQDLKRALDDSYDRRWEERLPPEEQARLRASGHEVKLESERQRLRDALCRLANGTQDSKPILIRAEIQLDLFLVLYVFDDGKDLVGFRIREECIDENGTVRTLEEDCPVFRDCWSSPPQELVNFYRFLAVIRPPCKARDESPWRTYADRLRLSLAHGSPSAGDRPSIPPLEIAHPVAGRVRVAATVYDAYGNESELEVSCEE